MLLFQMNHSKRGMIIDVKAESEDLNVPKERCFIDYSVLVELADVDAAIVVTSDFAHVDRKSVV